MRVPVNQTRARARGRALEKGTSFFACHTQRQGRQPLFDGEESFSNMPSKHSGVFGKTHFEPGGESRGLPLPLNHCGRIASISLAERKDKRNPFFLRRYCTARTKITLSIPLSKYPNVVPCPSLMPRISKGLSQAYQLQDFTFEVAMSLRDALPRKDGKLKITREDAQSIAALVKSWESCQQRIQVHRRVPNPGSLKHATETKSKRRTRIGMEACPPSPASQ